MDRTCEQEIAELLLFMVRTIVDHPDNVRVEPISNQEGTVFLTQVHVGDMGKLIGKEGKTARALRIIVAAAGMKLKRRFDIDIVQEVPQG